MKAINLEANGILNVLNDYKAFVLNPGLNEL